MVILLTTIHIIACLFLIVVVLLQSGKAADLAGAFGGMGSQTVFGPRGSATVLSKATTAAAAVFMVTSMALSIMVTREGKTGAPSLLDKAAKPASQQKAPATPLPGPGGTVPISVTPYGPDGKPGQPQQVPATVLPPGQTTPPAQTPAK
jgi:preprotein translocase subunit SecG